MSEKKQTPIKRNKKNTGAGKIESTLAADREALFFLVLRWVVLIAIAFYPSYKIVEYGRKYILSEELALKPISAEDLKKTKVAKILGHIRYNELDNAIEEINSLEDNKEIPDEVKKYFINFKNYYLNSNYYIQREIKKSIADSADRSDFANYSLERICDITDYLQKNNTYDEPTAYKLAEALPFFIITACELCSDDFSNEIDKPARIIALCKAYQIFITGKSTSLSRESCSILCLQMKESFNRNRSRQNIKETILEINNLKAKYSSATDNEAAHIMEAFKYLNLLEAHCKKILNRKGLARLANISIFTKFKEPVPGLKQKTERR